MKREYKLEAESFSLILTLKVYDADISYPSNTIMEVIVDSDGFCARTAMDIDIKEFKDFASAITDLYETLQGSAAITEPYGEQIIAFSADKAGHIMVSGMLHNYGYHRHNQTLTFENDFDQSFLQSFVNALNEI